MAPKVVVITSSPNKDGLTAACGTSAQEGAREAGAETVILDLNSLKIGRCQACGTGYGPCRSEHVCQVKDDFQSAHSLVLSADALVVVSPVYWGDLSESAKAFFDRLRRCESINRDEQGLKGKPVIGVAAAGGSGNGTVTCLFAMQQFFNPMKMNIFDLITVTRKSRPYKLEAIRSAAKAMVGSMQKQE